jgi:hypothetical protein
VIYNMSRMGSFYHNHQCDILPQNVGKRCGAEWGTEGPLAGVIWRQDQSLKSSPDIQVSPAQSNSIHSCRFYSSFNHFPESSSVISRFVKSNGTSSLLSCSPLSFGGFASTAPSCPVFPVASSGSSSRAEPSLQKALDRKSLPIL